MRFSLFPKPGQLVGPSRARVAFLVNQFATPGLGSLTAGRRVAGTGQLTLAVAGFALVLAWYIRVMTAYYNLMFDDVPVLSPTQQSMLWKPGVVLFGLAWLWALVTSISLLREARANALKLLTQPPEKPPVIPDPPPRLP